MTDGKAAGQLQDGLFTAAEYQGNTEPVLMALNPQFCELIWRGLKTHEFRRRFLEGRLVRWFVYLTGK